MGGARFHSTLLLGMLVLAGGAILVLAITAVWFTHHLTRDFTATRMRQNLTLVDQRIEQLAEAAVRFNALARRHVRLSEPLPTQFEPVMTSLADAFELQRELSYVGLAVESTGEYSMLQRTPGSGVTRNREYIRLPDDSREIRDHHFQDGTRRLANTLPWDGYDPRQRPFYLTAKAAGGAIWTDCYVFWGGNEQGEVPGLSYAVPLYTSETNLVGVLDVDFDLFDLSSFLAKLARNSDGYCFIVEERRDGNRVVVAHPEPGRILDPRTRLFPTNSLGVSDPVARAILDMGRKSPALLGSRSSKPLLVRANGAAYYCTARRFQESDLPRWSVVTVLPREVVLRETQAVYRWLAAAALVLLALSALLANRLAKHVAEPLRQLQDQMARQSAQSDPGPVTVRGATEFRLLAESFNRLITGINEQRQALLGTNRTLQSQIEQRQKAEAALRESQEKFRIAFNNSPDAIAITTLEEGRCLDVNESLCRLLGYTREEALRLTAPEFLYEKPTERVKVLEMIRREGRVRDYELRGRHKGGTLFESSLSIEPVTIQGQRCLIGIMRDITERKQAAAELKQHRDHLEELVSERTAELSRTNLVLATEVHERKRVETELRQANEHLQELDRLKSEFLATMSHELRTPLNSIIGFSGILRQRLAGPLTPEQEKQLGMVQSAARHLLGLINDLLDLSRIESGKMELHLAWFRLSDLTDEVLKTLEPLAHSKNLPLRFALNQPEAEIYSDRKKVFQILLNLANNALKFTEKGEVRVLVHSAPGVVQFTVRDTGIGIKPEHMGLLFEAFRQVDGSARRVYEGTGLGLYLCQKLASLLGGEIGAKSEFGKGSEFSFTLPWRA